MSDMIKVFASRFYYSFPIQLLMLHLRSNLLLLGLWGMLFLTVGGGFGSSMGFHYLFLDPEYLGEVSFWSFYIMGIAFGVFFMAWNTTTYILNSQRFPFLASLNRPYGKFSFNNLVLPCFFVVYYLVRMIDFQWYNEFAAEHSILSYCLGFLGGFFTILLIAVLYFMLTNKDIVSFERAHRLKISKVITAIVVKNQEKELDLARENPYRHALRVDVFLTEALRPRLVRSVRHYDFSMLEKVFRQNHANALLIQSLSITAIILMGALVEYPQFRIPSAASTMILFSVVATLAGAFTYWLRSWRLLVFGAIIFAINKLMGYGFYYENKAYGLDYTVPHAEYSYSALEKLCTPEQQAADMLQTQRILDRWRAKFTNKPKLVVLCSSGGGVRAGLWAMHVMRELDKSLGGKLMKNTVLMTGASGGMFGASYFRELHHQRTKDKKFNPYEDRYLNNVAKDLANALTFTLLVNDIFIPWVSRKVNGYTYKQDRGYIFEQQFIENTEGLMAMPLSYYRRPEEEARVPMMLLTPVIINDGRFLVVSPHPVSYMMKAAFSAEEGGDFAEVDGVDFRALFAKHNPDNMRFATAIRMSATYPYVLPNVHMPSNPVVEVMDAGFRDNYGIEVAARFLTVFRSWIRDNTSGVILIQIRGSEKITEVPKNRTRSFADYFTAISSVMDVDNLQDFHHDSYIGYLRSKLGYNKVDVFRFIYKPTKIEQRASLSLHLTQREKNDVLNAIYLEQNQNNIKEIKKLLR